VEDRTPNAVWMSADEIAEHAIDGAVNDRRVVVPGVLNRAGALVGQHSPRAVALPLIGRIWRNV
jgi:short-subunit dehydrogenase